jgi:hypothetical protein
MTSLSGRGFVEKNAAGWMYGSGPTSIDGARQVAKAQKRPFLTVVEDALSKYHDNRPGC